MKYIDDSKTEREAVKASIAYAESKGDYIISSVMPRPGQDMEKMAYLLDINKDKYFNILDSSDK